VDLLGPPPATLVAMEQVRFPQHYPRLAAQRAQQLLEVQKALEADLARQAEAEKQAAKEAQEKQEKAAAAYREKHQPRS
jgi:hypothetical protein